jgi:diadenosine tetraphosphate (Ap4A) HIT family hydrolase
MKNLTGSDTLYTSKEEALDNCPGRNYTLRDVSWHFQPRWQWQLEPVNPLIRALERLDELEQRVMKLEYSLYGDARED